MSVSVPGVGGPVLLRFSNRARRLSITVKSNGSVRVTIPKGVSVTRARQFLKAKEGWIRRSLDEFRRLTELAEEAGLSEPEFQKARAMLASRLERLARIHGFEYNRVTIRNQTSRWGSCSGKNNINLNVNLVRLPDDLRDYVMMHELVHTRVKNHSKQFWRELDKLVGDGKSMQRRLRDYRLR